MLIVAACLGTVLLLGIVVWIGTRMVSQPDPHAGSIGGSIGAGLGVFDPGAARAREEIDDKESQAEVLPTPDDDDHPRWKVDLHRGTVRIPRPKE